MFASFILADSGFEPAWAVVVTKYVACLIMSFDIELRDPVVWLQKIFNSRKFKILVISLSVNAATSLFSDLELQLNLAILRESELVALERQPTEAVSTWLPYQPRVTAGNSA
jgi:hypothetical protein